LCISPDEAAVTTVATVADNNASTAKKTPRHR
jgi:hypothetical protein